MRTHRARGIGARGCGVHGRDRTDIGRASVRHLQRALRAPTLSASHAVRGSLYVGTSGFAYPTWAPRFYPEGTRSSDLLSVYGARLSAVELNATYRARPSAASVARWVARTPPGFRFAVKAQRGASWRGMTTSPDESIAWLLEPMTGFGEKLGAILFRVPDTMSRRGPESDAALRRFLAAWPAAVPLVVELQDRSWHVDETFAALRGHGATLCTTELPEDAEPPTIRLTGDRLYLRLRRHDYTDDELRAWADRTMPFLDAGHDALVFFRHDEVGRGAELALAFDRLVAERYGT